MEVGWGGLIMLLGIYAGRIVGMTNFAHHRQLALEYETVAYHEHRQETNILTVIVHGYISYRGALSTKLNLNRRHE